MPSGNSVAPRGFRLEQHLSGPLIVVASREIAALVPDGRHLGAVKECDGGRLALHGVPAFGPKGELAFLEYVDKAYRETQGGDRAAGPHLREVVFGARQSVQTGPHLPVGSRDFGQEGLFVCGDDKSREPQETSGEGFGSLDRAQPCLVDALWVVFTAHGVRLLRRSQVEEARMPSSVVEVGGGAACGVARRGQLAGSRAKLLGVT